MYSTATSSEGDYASLSALLTFPNGSADGAEVCAPVTVYSDKLVEHEDKFMMALDLVTSGANFSIGNNVSSISLTDSDGMYSFNLPEGDSSKCKLCTLRYSYACTCMYKVHWDWVE